MKAALLLILVALAGCDTLKEHSAVPEKEVVNFDRSLLKKCEGVEALASGKDVDNIKFTEKTLSKLTECGTRQNKLVDEVKKAFNIKE